MSRICILTAFIMLTAAYVYHRSQTAVVGDNGTAPVQRAGDRSESPQVNSVKMDLVSMTQ